MFGGPVAALAVGAGPPEPIRSATATSAAALSAHFVMTATSPGCGPDLTGSAGLEVRRGRLRDRLPERDGQAVEPVDRDDDVSEPNELLLGEHRGHLGVRGVGGVGLADQRQLLAPLERGPLTIGVTRGVAPDGQQLEALVALSSGPGCAHMGVDAVGASVE